MKTILVLTDFSVRAAYAAEYAMHFAIKNHANLLICNTIEVGSNHGKEELFGNMQPSLGLLKEERLMDLKELGGRLEKLIRPGMPDFKPSIEYMAAFGPLAEVAEKIINDRAAGMVVMGAHRTNCISRLLSGSHVHHFLDKINCPVLLIPECFPFKHIDTIGYATDHSFDNAKVMKYLIKLAKPFRASLSINFISKVGHRITPEERASNFSFEFRPDYPGPPISYHNIKGDNVKASLKEITRLGQVDILAMVHKQYHHFERLFHSSITKHLVDDTQIPILVLPYSFAIDTTDRANNHSQRFFKQPLL